MKCTSEEVAAWCRTFRILFDTNPAQVVLLDLQGRILATNIAWREFGRCNGLADSFNSVGKNYLDACEAGAAANFPGSRDAYVGLLEVLHARRPKFTMVYPCHSPTQRRWYRMWVQPQMPNVPVVVVAHYLCAQEPVATGLKDASFGNAALARGERKNPAAQPRVP